MYSQPVPYLFSQHHPLLVLQEQDDEQGVGQKNLPGASKSQQQSQESQPGTVQINTSVLWLCGKVQVWDLRGGGELGVGREAQKRS